MKRNGFVVSAVLYPLLVLFLALIMGLLSMTDTRKRILDKMKLEISDSIFDEATCSCDTILNKLNYIIKNGTGGGGSGSLSQNALGLNILKYEVPGDMPNVRNNIGDIAVITDSGILESYNYYVSNLAPINPKEGDVWIVQDTNSKYYVTSDYSKIGINYAMEYTGGKWKLRKTYVYEQTGWTLLYYVSLKDGNVDLTSSDIHAEISKEYSYTGNVQTFTATFSGYHQIELWGAQGGSFQGYTGGKGAYTSGEIYLNAGEKLYLYVGEQPTTESGGWNGGGNGKTTGSGQGRGGGGATDVRLVKGTTWKDFISLKSRIMVAAGGGGASRYTVDGNYYSNGGSGGALTGLMSIGRGSNGRNDDYQGTGGTQSAPGHLFSNTMTLVGGFGYGGNSGGAGTSDGGGGSGYYGGGGGTDIGAGGGGSSYISGYVGCSSIDLIKSTNDKNIIHTGSPYHQSDYYFQNTIMVNGNTTTTLQNGTSISGNTGNGKAKITLLTVEVKDQGTLLLEQDKKAAYHFYYSGTDPLNGNYQIFTTPVTGTYQVDLAGAQGGSFQGYTGGKGASTFGKIYLTKGQNLYLYVGSSPAAFGSGGSNTDKGGWNGGGNGKTTSHGQGRGGGGATDVRLLQGSNWDDFSSLKSRIMVAAGGGGATRYTYDGNYYSNGGSGGALTGLMSIGRGSNGRNDAFQGTGGTQSAPGYYYSNFKNLMGGFGYGGNSGGSGNSDGGGGSGYYGGGGGNDIGAGGGGSSYISGHTGCSSIDTNKSLSKTTIIHTGSPYHDSGYYFKDTAMTSGTNSGDGKATIVLLSETNTTGVMDTKTTRNYYYSGNTLAEGNYQIFTAPATGKYKIELWGAQGGSFNSYYGGNGGYTYGEIELNANTNLYIYVGSDPTNESVLEGLSDGGWNGGGNGKTTSNGQGRGGGGATDIRAVSSTSVNSWNDYNSLKSRIMVAAGGGGATRYTYDGDYYSTGGPGGGLIGLISPKRGSNGRPDENQGTGGTQIAAGYLTSSKTLVGGFGYGGNSGGSGNSDGGGGSGWYGGGGGNEIGAGGGGSSYISGHAGCIAVDASGHPKASSYTILTDSISYTGYKFSNTKMIDGSGYEWTTVKLTSSNGMPSQNGASSISGNSGHGFAKITYLGA